MRYGRALVVLSCLVAAYLLVPVDVHAQGATQASITGLVRDGSGGVLPGVTIEAASPALIEKVRTGVTDGSGRYRIISLPPGTIRCHLHAAGFPNGQT